MAEEKVVQTMAGEVVLPVEDVTLTGKALRRKDGAPLVVRVEFIEEEKLVSIIEAAPGYAPELGIKQEKGVSVETARALLRYAPGLIGAACVIVGPDGTEQRPAFHFGPDPKDGSLPGRFLSTPEKLRLLMTALRVSGFAGGPADDVAFRDGVGEGSDVRAGTVDAREGDGGASVRPDDGRSEGVAAPADAGARA